MAGLGHAVGLDHGNPEAFFHQRHLGRRESGAARTNEAQALTAGRALFANATG